jgi:hypothetical protein
MGEVCRLEVLENRVLRSKRDQVNGDWRRFHIFELHDLYSENIVKVITLRRMRWVGHLVLWGRGQVHTKF